MSQAALNTRDRENTTPSGRTNGAQFAGIIFLLMVLGTIVWSGYAIVKWMNDSQRLPLSRLVVIGERHYTTNDDIRQAIMSLGEPGTFMSQDVNIIQQQIGRLPWLKQVSVRKQWPDELKINIVEYSPAARWNDLQMIDASGHPFSLPNERVKTLALPLLYGPEGSGDEVLEGYHEINKLLTAAKFKVKSVSMSARRSWQLTLDNDVRIELGRNNRVERLDRFIEIYPVLVQQGQVSNQKVNYVDLRYDTGVSVGWSPIFIDQTGGVNRAPVAQ